MADYFTYVTGWRVWRINEAGLADGRHRFTLAAVHIAKAAPWPTRVPYQARCHGTDGHPNPTWHALTSRCPLVDCGCGIYGFRQNTPVRRELDYTKSQTTFPYGFAWGPVALWGHLMEHDLGYRAEFAYPIALSLLSPYEAAGRSLADEYAVPVRMVEVLPDG